MCEIGIHIFGSKTMIGSRIGSSPIQMSNKLKQKLFADINYKANSAGTVINDCSEFPFKSRFKLYVGIHFKCIQSVLQHS